jgi:salicylate hydroxylase
MFLNSKSTTLLTSHQLFERSDFESSAGISLALAPNATRVLTKWGIDLEALNMADADATELAAIGGIHKVEQVRHVDGMSGNTTWKEDLSDWILQYGNSLNFMRYKDLHKGLLDQSKALGVILNLNEQVVDMNCEKATLTTAGGKIVQKDLIIVAAGWNVSLQLELIICLNPIVSFPPSHHWQDLAIC